jgi:hypothetical protein
MLYEVNFSLARDFSVSQYLLFPKAVAHWLPGERLLLSFVGGEMSDAGFSNR